MNLYKILYPDRCPICDRARPVFGAGVCPECLTKIKIVPLPVCEVCGRPVEKNVFKCKECETARFSFDGGRSVFAYSSLNDSIYRFKYMKRPAYAKPYAELMYREIKDWLDWLSPDVLVPVPLHKKRLIARGYNQAKELAEELSKLTGIPVEDSVLERTKNTLPQKLTDRRGRQINMKKAFIVRENVVKFRRIVLIDDIFTTGSTIDSAAFSLKASGVSEVYFLTLSRAGI